MSERKRIGAVFALFSLLACGSGGSSGSGADEGGSPASSAPQEEGLLTRPGQSAALVTVGTYTAEGIATDALDALFYEGPLDQGSGAQCEQRAMGSCFAFACTGPDGAPSSLAATAGMLEITGGAKPIGVTPEDGEDYHYVTTNAWSATDPLSLSFSGGDVPAFTASNLLPPASLTLVQPVGSPKLTAGQALMVQWTGTGGDQMWVAVSSAGFPARIDCLFSADSGSGTIDGTLTSLLQEGAASFVACSISQKRMTTGKWDVTVRTQSSMSQLVLTVE
jgi:hypothetical protein